MSYGPPSYASRPGPGLLSRHDGEPCGLDEVVDGFICYAHHDYKMLEVFKRHLDANKQVGGVSYWADPHIRGGQKWRPEIAKAIDQAQVFLLLLSAAFAMSDYIRYTERPAIEARAAGCNGLIVPVILNSFIWEPHVGRLQALPIANGRLKPVDRWGGHDRGVTAAHQQLLDAIHAHWPAPIGVSP